MREFNAKYDAAGLALALIIHVGALAYVYLMPPIKKRQVTTIEVEVRKPKPPPPPITPPEPPKPLEPEKPPEPPKKLVTRRVQPAQSPKPSQEPPKDVPKPVFGIDPSQTGGDGISVPTGNTTIADPEKRPKVTEVPKLAPAGNVPTGSEYRPISEEELKSPPEHINDECGSAMKQKWTESESNANGQTGDIVLRIELDEKGKVRNIKVVHSFSKEVDKIALGFMRFDPRCRFRPAVGKDGKAAAFVIERYTVSFERQ